MKVDNKYRKGEAIYGDDFSYEQIEQWYMDEANGYAGIVPEEHKESFDEYQKETDNYLYRYLKRDYYPQVMSYGGGYATEIMPIVDKLGDVTILEPGEKFQRSELCGKPVTYKKPTVSGEMEFEDDTFDLIICLGVLHHVPNVSFILKEMHRVLRSNGVLLIREPITSMNVFDEEIRKGLTRRERGLPYKPFCTAITAAGLTVSYKHVYRFGPFMKLKSRYFFTNTSIGRAVDQAFCRMFMFNYRYDAKGIVQRFRPTSIAMVLQK